MTMTLVSTAHHESGHAVATVLAFRNAAWLPRPPPSLPVRYVEVTEDDGNCVGADIYSTRWAAEDRIAPHYRPLMEWQVVIELSGGIAEALYRGERRPHAVLAFAQARCGMNTDLERARAVIDDLRALTGRAHCSSGTRNGRAGCCSRIGEP
jgi:hypothetical protein